jgi:hypothetical protein
MTGPKRVTEKQLAANRRNALKSTGPRTPEGKAVSRYNALKHGILAKAVIPPALEPYESRADFDDLLDAFEAQFAPANRLEALLVQQMAIIYWRLARLYRAEAGTIANGQDRAEWSRARDKLAEEQGPFAALAESGKHRDVEPDPHHPDDPWPTHSQDVDYARHSLPHLDTALKYARYETTLQNRLNHALAALERLQRQRSGAFVAPPVVIDVTGVELPDEEG